MDNFLEKAGKFLGDPKINRAQFIFTMIAVFIFIFIGTDIFTGLSDGWKLIIYLIFTATAILGGVNYSAIKTLQKIREVYIDSKLTADQKILKIGSIVLEGIKHLNDAWVEKNEEQGTNFNYSITDTGTTTDPKYYDDNETKI